MLKADMRQYILEGKTFEDFMADNGEEVNANYPPDVIQRAWERTSTQFVDDDEWIRYLKNTAAKNAAKLDAIVDELNKEGYVLNGTKAGGIVARMLDKQRRMVGITA